MCEHQQVALGARERDRRAERGQEHARAVPREQAHSASRGEPWRQRPDDHDQRRLGTMGNPQSRNLPPRPAARPWPPLGSPALPSALPPLGSPALSPARPCPPLPPPPCHTRSPPTHHRCRLLIFLSFVSPLAPPPLPPLSPAPPPFSPWSATTRRPSPPSSGPSARSPSSTWPPPA